MIREIIINSIHIIRGQRVMLDFDLSSLYGVETKVLNQSVKRNIERFPCDFMFKLTQQEFSNLRSQIVTSSLEGYGGARYLPFAFNEQGVAMLSSVLRSPSAIKVNIEIVRSFVKYRRHISDLSSLELKISDLESNVKQKFLEQDVQISEIFKLINAMIKQDQDSNESRLGFDVYS